jgi:hypothetical protein
LAASGDNSRTANRIEQPRHAVAGQKLAARDVALANARGGRRPPLRRAAFAAHRQPRIRAALAENAAEPVSILDAIGNRIPPKRNYTRCIKPM